MSRPTFKEEDNKAAKVLEDEVWHMPPGSGPPAAQSPPDRNCVTHAGMAHVAGAPTAEIIVSVGGLFEANRSASC
jgi:hypothetical protein